MLGAALQVHRALKHAVNAGLLRHRSGRYKALATLNPASGPTPSANKESTNGDRKTEEKKSKSDGQTPIGDAESSSRRTQEHKYVAYYLYDEMPTVSFSICENLTKILQKRWAFSFAIL